MSDIDIRVQGRAGRITFQRPKALNALTYDMLRAIDAALDRWRADDAVKLVLIDAAGDKAFCAGGDIADLYASGKAGNYAYGQQFWRDEYHLNAKLAEYPKPIVSLMQGFTMGGGVGIGCHASHRVVGENSQIAMPECGIGLIPDVGGSLILAQAPGRLGEYLGMTGARMGPGDAIYAGFADFFVPQKSWPDLVAHLEKSGEVSAIKQAAAPARARLMESRAEIDFLFAGKTLAQIADTCAASDSEIAQAAAKALARNAPLSMACTLDLLTRVRATPTIRDALTLEYRFTARSMEHGDFLEGIRAAIIDKDRNPQWKHRPDTVTAQDIDTMLAPLGENELTWKDMP